MGFENTGDLGIFHGNIANIRRYVEYMILFCF